MDQCELEQWARRIRCETLKMIHKSTGGHPGGALSIADILAVLYFHEMNLDSKVPNLENRDRCVLSKGHACAALYATLGLKGYFDQEEFNRFRRIDGLLQGHPSISIPGIDAPSGSLGMGLSQGLGMALGGKYLKRDFRTYVLLGDGDMQEGNTWEALMAAGYKKVSNLCAILDANKLQADGFVAETMDFTPLDKKLTAFGWHTLVVDGHDIGQILQSFETARQCSLQPTFIIANTIKGKGVPFMENQPEWHGTVPISKEDLAIALDGLSC